MRNAWNLPPEGENKSVKSAINACYLISVGLFARSVLTLNVWKWASVSFSYPRGSSALISSIMVSKHPTKTIGSKFYDEAFQARTSSRVWNGLKTTYTYWAAPVLGAGCTIAAPIVTPRSSLLRVHSYRERAHLVITPLKKEEKPCNVLPLLWRQYLKSSWSVAESRHQLSLRPLEV